jgi:hypothetical protein
MYLSTRAASSVLSALLLKSLSLIPTSLRDELFLMKNKKRVSLDYVCQQIRYIYITVGAIAATAVAIALT